MNIMVILDVQLWELGTQRLHQRLSETILMNTEGDKSDRPKDNTTLMEVEDSIQKPQQGETVPPTEEMSVATGGITPPTSVHNDCSNVEMKDVNIDILNVSGKGEMIDFT